MCTLIPHPRTPRRNVPIAVGGLVPPTCALGRTVAGDVDLGEVRRADVDHLLADDVAAEQGAPLVGRRSRPAAAQVVHHRLTVRRACRHVTGWLAT